MSCSCDNTFKKLELANAVREYHHAALWEEEKHYTWILSLLVPAIVFFAAQSPIKTPWIQWSAVAVLSALGIVLAKVALAVIRLESGYFQEAFARYLPLQGSAFGEAYSDTAATIVPPSRRKMLQAFFGGRGLKIREAFQFTFVLFEGVFIVLVVVAFSQIWLESLHPWLCETGRITRKCS